MLLSQRTSMARIHTTNSNKQLLPDNLEQLRPRLIRRVAKYLSYTGYRRPSDAELVLETILGEVWIGLAELTEPGDDPNWKPALRRALYREFEQGRRNRAMSLDQMEFPESFAPTTDSFVESPQQLFEIEQIADGLGSGDCKPLKLTATTRRNGLSRRELRIECTKLWMELTHGKGPENLTRRFSRVFNYIILESDSKHTMRETRRILRYTTMLKLPHALASARTILTRWAVRRGADRIENQESSSDSLALLAKAESEST